MSDDVIHSASDLVTSLLRQLCLQLNTVPDRLQRAFKQTSGESGPSLGWQELLEALKEVSRSANQKIAIIVDGWDETNTCEQNGCLQVFDSLKDTSWEWLVTSRASRNILPTACKDISEFTIGEDANKEDIRNFVISVLSESEPIDRMLESDPELRSRLEDTLTSQAHGR